jgi:hypothetical protein
VKKRSAALAVACVAAALIGGSAAYAATSASTIRPTAVYACEGSGHVAVTPLSSPSAKCPAGTTSIVIGAKGSTGAQGPAGATGSTGPSGVQALAKDPFAEKDGIVTGGPFLSNATLVGTAPLGAGTYQICVNGKAEQPTAASGSVSAQLFVYDADALANQSFDGDLINVSTDTQGGTHHDAYLDGCTLVTEASDVTLRLYGFGYDSDSGSGSWNLMDAKITMVKLTPAS